jgi:small subunit ribosomal protein S3
LGQKTHPVGFRLGVNRAWNSRWFARGATYRELIFEDMQVRRYVKSRLNNAGVAKVAIQRAPKKVTVDIHTSRPGIVIGRKGSEVDKLRSELQLLTGKDITLNIVEVKKPELSAQLVADGIAYQLTGRIAFRRAMKKSIAATMKMGAQGIKIICGGRLNGAEIARSEKYHQGRVPLHTLRGDIDYATSTARTTYGAIGVKVWICKGEILDRGDFADHSDREEPEALTEMGATQDRSRKRGGPPERRKPRRPRGRVRRRTESGSEAAPAGGAKKSESSGGAKASASSKKSAEEKK